MSFYYLLVRAAILLLAEDVEMRQNYGALSLNNAFSSRDNSFSSHINASNASNNNFEQQQVASLQCLPARLAIILNFELSF